MSTDDAIVVEEEIPSNEDLNPQSEDQHILIIDENGGWALSHPSECRGWAEGDCPLFGKEDKFEEQVAKNSESLPMALKVSTGKSVRFTQVDATLTYESEGEEPPEDLYAVVPADLEEAHAEDGPEAQWPSQEPGEQEITKETPDVEAPAEEAASQDEGAEEEAETP